MWLVILVIDLSITLCVWCQRGCYPYNCNLGALTILVVHAQIVQNLLGQFVSRVEPASPLGRPIDLVGRICYTGNLVHAYPSNRLAAKTRYQASI